VAAVLGGLAVVGIGVVLGIVWFTTLDIPGWATNAVGFLVLFMLQMVLFSGISVFSLLYTRSHQVVVPARDMLHLIRTQETLWHEPTDIPHV
jgi:hypothetical protein